MGGGGGGEEVGILIYTYEHNVHTHALIMLS